MAHRRTEVISKSYPMQIEAHLFSLPRSMNQGISLSAHHDFRFSNVLSWFARFIFVCWGYRVSSWGVEEVIIDCGGRVKDAGQCRLGSRVDVSFCYETGKTQIDTTNTMNGMGSVVVIGLGNWDG